jgi:hypothetical protein
VTFFPNGHPTTSEFLQTLVTSAAAFGGVKVRFACSKFGSAFTVLVQNFFVNHCRFLVDRTSAFVDKLSVGQFALSVNDELQGDLLAGVAGASGLGLAAALREWARQRDDEGM